MTVIDKIIEIAQEKGKVTVKVACAKRELVLNSVELNMLSDFRSCQLMQYSDEGPASSHQLLWILLGTTG